MKQCNVMKSCLILTGRLRLLMALADTNDLLESKGSAVSPVRPCQSSNLSDRSFQLLSMTI